MHSHFIIYLCEIKLTSFFWVHVNHFFKLQKSILVIFFICAIALHTNTKYIKLYNISIQILILLAPAVLEVGANCSKSANYSQKDSLIFYF